jgi:hypothetical protein
MTSRSATLNTNCAQVPVTTFDYGSIPSDIADSLRKQAALIREKDKAWAMASIEIGRDLLAVRQHLRGRQFCKWVMAECGFSLSSAYNYMGAAEFAENLTQDKFPTVANLHPKTLYVLARPSTPQEIVDEVIARAATGATVPWADVDRMLDNAKEQRREAARREKRAARRGRLSKKKREQEDAAEAARERQRAEEEEAAKSVARTIIKLSPECAALLLETKASLFGILQHLRQELGKTGEPDDEGGCDNRQDLPPDPPSIIRSTEEPEIGEAVGGDPPISPTETPKTMESTSVSSTLADNDPLMGIPNFLDRRRGVARDVAAAAVERLGADVGGGSHFSSELIAAADRNNMASQCKSPSIAQMEKAKSTLSKPMP